ncbi:MAG: type I glutamate--ammonia ligase [Candidatus Schekmanbacteria bacterium RBG_13_48_7]|uniref:Glutamine synthetase n=1 Tax=Candidatus Schekmanbacteria bacterium RBG_13_48_7 TaxID=1817878 RepID=A0A1F7RX79_9BACT|nr:MAG: type I glutamate--ammonia ligase [Candidatus Schekmanbacteria bacterium RBG_13_48_7]
MNKEVIREKVKEENVRFLQLQFVDILGVPKAVEVPVTQIEKVLNNSILFDGSSIEGFARIIESDMYLAPDLSTFMIDRDNGTKLGRFFCDIYRNPEEPFDGCPRINLKRVIKEVQQKHQLEMMVGTEAEFFLFELDEKGEIIFKTQDKGGYFDLLPLDQASQLRREIVDVLQEYGIEVEALHHEVAAGQQEIDFKYSNPLKTADNLMLFKTVIKVKSRKYKLHATFMPKPIQGINGSGMHTHVSLWKGDVNKFHDSEDPQYHLSDLARKFIAGIMKHAPAMTAIANPIVNSYKRLVPGYEAPVDIAWSPYNRSPMLRLPKGEKSSKRIEIRSPDPAANPYLLFAAILTAGIDGIENNLSCPEPIIEDFFEQDETWRIQKKIKSLPSFLSTAIRELEADLTIQKAFTEHILKKFIQNKKFEVKNYQTTVHPWEVARYLSIY